MDQDDFGYYHPEPEEKKKTSSKWVLGTGVMGANGVSAIWGWDKDYGDWGDYEPEPKKKEKEVKCECGSSAIKWPIHSDWCPKYRRPDEE